MGYSYQLEPEDRMNTTTLTYYAIKMDRRYPYALVLKPDSTRPEEYTGHEDTQELHQNMKDTFGPDAKQLPGTQFQAEIERRSVHTKEMLALLEENGQILDRDLVRCYVYGSYNRPMDGTWARVHEEASYLPANFAHTGYHTYVCVPYQLEAETLERYELVFISHPADFPEVFYASDRNDARAHAEHPLTLEYIRRLEQIAEAAFLLYNNSPSVNELVSSYRNDLYDALNAINFLDESL